MTQEEILLALSQGTINAKDAFRMIKELGKSVPGTSQVKVDSHASESARDWVYSTCEQTFRMDADRIPGDASFIDLGANSLLMQELIRKVEARFGVIITPDQFMAALSTVDGLVAFIESRLGEGNPKTQSQPIASKTGSKPLPKEKREKTLGLSSPKTGEMSPTQKEYLDRFIEAFADRTKASKIKAEKCQQSFSDQRSGWFFTPELKEIHYPLVFSEGSGAYLKDIDGNEYLDLTGDFGVNLFGHADRSIQSALIVQYRKGLSLSTSSPLLSEAAEMFCEMTGMDRVVFTQSGTEAVMSALRLARAATGRSKIVKFNGAFHGHFDGILISASSMPHPSYDGVCASRPHFPGTPQSFAEDVLFLDYDSEQSLEVIERVGGELAAILVEPIQSRNPEIQPEAFLKNLRAISKKHKIVLIFDEMITGFRVHPRGIQGYYGIECDLCTYGKVITGGLSGGCVAGKAELMEWVNGGNWRFGDDSRPSLKTTFIAGTHTQNPAFVAGVHTVLKRLKELGPEFQEAMNRKTRYLVESLNARFVEQAIPLQLVYFGSLFRFRFLGDSEGSNAHTYSREMAIFSKLLQHKHILYNQQGNCFLTAAHGEPEIQKAMDGILAAAGEMMQVGFFKAYSHKDMPAAKPSFSAFPITKSESIERFAKCLPLSIGQQGLFFEYQIKEDQRDLNMPLCFRMTVKVDIERLRDSFGKVQERHSALRTNFELDGDLPVQMIHGEKELSFFHEKMPDATAAQIRKKVEEAYAIPFDLQKDTLFRVHLFTVSDRDHYTLLVVPHIIADGFSLQRIVQDFLHFYGKGETLETPFEYEHFIDEEAELMDSERGERLLAYWKDALAAPLEALQLPTDFVRTQEFEAGRLHFEISPDQTAALKTFSREQRCTLFTLMVTAYAVLLHKYSGQSDVLIDFASVPGDRTTRYGHTLGYFINKLCLRVKVDKTGSLSDLLKATGEMVLKGTMSRDYPFPTLARELGISGQAESLFRAMINMDIPFDLSELTDVQKRSYNALGIETVDFVEQVWPRDVFLNIIEDKKTLKCVLGYNTRLFTEESMDLIQTQFVALLHEISHSDKPTLGDLHITTTADQKGLLEDWNSVRSEYPSSSAVHQLFEAQKKKTPKAVAVQYAPSFGAPVSLSYGELNARANQLAHYLVKEGVTPGSLIAICMERTPDLLVAMLATLKTGAAYLPIDESFPVRRKAFMIEDAGCLHLITQERVKDTFPQTKAKVHYLDALSEAINVLPTRNLKTSSKADDLAYVMYTSGSTGNPKGVMIPHRAISRLVCGSNYVNIQPGDRVAQLANAAFDASTFEIWGPLLNGGQTVIFEKNVALSPHDLKTLFRTHQIQTVFVTTALLNQFAREAPDIFAGMRDVLFGGELVDPKWVREILDKGAPERLLHVYGPTESTTYASWYEIRELPDKIQTIPIGKPLSNTSLYVLDEALRPCPVNVPGELYIGGDGLALGYLNCPELTAAVFIPDPFVEETGARLYKTGDRVRLRPDTSDGYAVEFLWRMDHQIKLRGFRIEMGEIEAALSEHPGIREAVVIVHGKNSNDKRLVAYIVSKKDGKPDDSEIRSFLWDRLPEYMIPSAFVRMDALPLNANKKVDRKALPEPDFEQSNRSNRVMPQNEAEQQIAEVWKQVLNLGEVGIYDNFFDLGGHSLLLIEVHSKLKDLFGDEVSIVKLFQYPNIHELAKHLSSPKNHKTEVNEHRPVNETGNRDIAIIGMSGRFPGANDLEQFWENLESVVESIRFFTDEELTEAGVDPSLLKNPAYVKAYGKLDNIEYFDAEFFGYSPAEAQLMDPQHRLFLHCAWESFEQAGYDVKRLSEKVGVFAGASRNTYFYNHIFQNKDIIDHVDPHQLLINNGNEFIPTRLSYKLNLRGPSINVQTACSTSLVAVHMACQSLLNGECSMALAGGATVDTPQIKGYLYQTDGIDSPDGHCRAFDAKAQGSVSGNGIGVVMLKPLAQALEDGDSIHAVIKSTAINNDGTAKVGYTAPGIEGQAEVIGTALRDLDAESIRFIETHGTGTPLGDPVELTALMQAYASRTSKTGYCSLTALKTNIGHLDAAAGIAGLIKTALVLKHRKLPPVVHFECLNPQIQLDQSPFTICSELTELKAENGPLRGAVSSFGIGGTNAHAILEEAPTDESGQIDTDEPQIVLFSAKTESALETMSANLAGHLGEFSGTLSNVAYTLQVGRSQFAHRRFTVGKSVDDVRKSLAEGDPAQVFSANRPEQNREVAFLFPGVGDHYENMALDLYLSEPVFKEHFDHCCEYFSTLIDADLRNLIFPDGAKKKVDSEKSGIDLRKMLNREQAPASESEDLLKQARYNQPAVFAVEYALARLWLSWGVKPSAMLGYSLGEYTAACLSGVFSVEDAMELLAFRSQMIQELPSGVMFAVLSDAESIEPYLGDGVSLAIHSTSRQCVVAGNEDKIAALQEKLKEAGIANCRLPTSHPLHTPTMEICRARLVEKIRNMQLNPPEIPYISNVSGDWIKPEQACSAEYWADHTCKTVRFASCLSLLLQKPDTILLEVGPGRSLGVLANQHVEKQKEQITLASMRNHFHSENDLTFLLRNLGKLWLSGAEIDWQTFNARRQRKRVPLPTYPFESKAYWIEPVVTGSKSNASPIPEVRAPISYQTRSWQRQKASVWNESACLQEQSWLIVSNDDVLADQFLSKLESLGQKVVSMDFSKVIATDFETQSVVPGRIVLFVEKGNFERFANLQSWISKLLKNDNARLDICSQNLQYVTGEETIESDAPRMLGMIQHLQHQNPEAAIRHVDLLSDKFDDGTALQILAVMGEPPTRTQTLALRGTQRWSLVTHEGISAAESGNPYAVKNCNFVISDGLSTPGLSFAGYLARHHVGKIALVTRESFPARENWDELLNESIEGDDPKRSVSEPFRDLIEEMLEIEKTLDKKLSVPLFYDYDGLIDQLNRLCSRHILDYFSTGLSVQKGNSSSLDCVREKLRILPKFEKFFQFILQILSDDDLIAIQGSELTFQVNLEDIQSITQMREAIISAVPELEESLDYLGNCVSKYGEALSGEIEAISVLYPEGRGADMIRPEEDDSYTYTNQRLYVNVLAETISGMLLKEPGKPLRILEIGGGNGYLTQAVTELVKDRNVEYFFTDLGPSLVRYSEENAIQKGYDSFMQFGVLDISTDCCEQGFEAHRFDLIMGLDVVHATPHISETVRNLKMLLAPEGLLCLIEPVKQQRWIDLAGGLAEGWWYFEDYELRNLSPLLNFAQWEHVLEQQGFPNIRSFPDSKEARDRTDAGLFIAQQSSYCSIDESAVLDDREQWIAHRIRAIFALEANGAETYLFDIGHQEDLGGVVEALNKTFQKVDGVIHDLDMGQPFDWITPLHPKQMILHGVKETLERSPETYASLVSANYWMEQNSASIEQSALLECSFGEDRGSFSDYACVLHDVFTQGLQGSYTLIRQHTEQPFREEKAIAGSISKTVHQRPNLMNEYVAPRNEIERTVVGIWEKVLGVNQIGIYDEFAGLGGDSLIAIRITARIRDALNVQVPVMTLMKQPTVAALSENIAAHLISQPGVEEEVNDEEDFVEGKL